MRLAAALIPLSMAVPAKADPVQEDAPQRADTEHTRPWLDGACSYTTAMFERRILEDGSDYAFTGHVQTTDDTLDNHVAAPLYVGEDTSTRLIDNDIVRAIYDEIDAGERVTIRGKRLLIGEVAYIAATEAATDREAR